MIQPARVLPSNASPLRDGDNVYHASRILQEHSGNRQQSDFSFGDESEQKYPSYSVLSENSCAAALVQYPQQHQAPQLYHPQPQHRQAWRYGYGRGGHRLPAPEEEASVRFDAERLYSRFRKSDSYLKYRNRQTKDDKGNGDQKWPDHLEKAFFRALVQWPPMGRRKLFWKEKQRGRNELIADCIKEITGDLRTRKQVSSHIQVLKPFVENDPYIMKWLAKDDMGAHAGRYGRGGTAYTSGRRMSNYPVAAPPASIQATMRSMPRLDIAALRKAKTSLNVFEPADFQMFVQRNYKVSKEHEEVERMHTYSQSISTPLEEPLHLDDMQTFQQDFPLLASIRPQRRLECNILDAEASIAFPTETWKAKDGSPIPGIELGIYFLCKSSYLPPTPALPTSKDRAYQIIVHNSFYENGVCVKDHSGPSEARFEPSERGVGVETRIKFGSTFWARTLGRLAGRLLDTSRDHHAEVASYLQSINAVQEIIAYSEHGPERLLLIHWKFRLSTSTTGRASWRRLVPPIQYSQNQSPVKLETAASMYDYSQVADPSTSQVQYGPAHVALQSPFEYESSTGSTLSSATWPTSVSDGTSVGQQNIGPDFSVDNTFDFNGGSMNLSYDTGFNFEHFDSSAFNFDIGSSADFAADPALHDYSQGWYDAYASTFSNESQAIDGTGSFHNPADLDSQTSAYTEFPGYYDSQTYAGTQDSQAYGGAKEGMKDEDALVALADASFMASALSTKPESDLGTTTLMDLS